MGSRGGGGGGGGGSADLNTQMQTAMQLMGLMPSLGSLFGGGQGFGSTMDASTGLWNTPAMADPTAGMAPLMQMMAAPVPQGTAQRLAQAPFGYPSGLGSQSGHR
jgi:hypothetical protein